MDILAEMAQELGKSAEELRWKKVQFIVIYAPVMCLVIDALNEMQYTSLAQDYAKRFCNAS